MLVYEYTPKAMSTGETIQHSCLSFRLSDSVIYVATATLSAALLARWASSAHASMTAHLAASAAAQAVSFCAMGFWLLRQAGSLHRPSQMLAALGVRSVAAAVMLESLLLGMALQILLAELATSLHMHWPLPALSRQRLAQIVSPPTAAQFWLHALLVVLVAAASEEFFFRGVLLAGLRQRYGAERAVVVTSLLFGVSHWQPVAIVYATVAGGCLALLRIWTGSLLPGLVAHAAVNALPFVLAAGDWRIDGVDAASDGLQHVPLAWLLGASAIAAGCLLRIRRRAMLRS